MNRLGTFWRRRSRRYLSLLVVVAGVVVIAVVGVVNGTDKEADVASEATDRAGTADLTTTSDPIRCLDAAGLSDVEERDVDLWRGVHDAPFYAIVVHRLATPAKAPMVVAGTYAVTGPFKVVAEGAGLTSDEGLAADALVQEVAACLGR